MDAASLNLCSLQKPNKDDYHAITAYGTSKLCNVLFGLELNRILIPVGVTCNVVHPGNLLSTNMLRNAGIFYNLLRLIMRPFVKSVVSELIRTCVIFIVVCNTITCLLALFCNSIGRAA